MSSQPRLSSDGLFYWNGTTWVSTLSPDGRHRWDGARWVALSATYMQPAYAPRPVPAPPPAPRTVRAATSWTRPLQTGVALFYGLVALSWTAVGVIVAIRVPDYVHRFIAYEEATHPNDALPPPGYDAGMMATVWTALAVVLVAVIVVSAVVIAGAVRRWGWVHYAAIVLLALQALSLPFTVAEAFGWSRVPGITGDIAWMAWASSAVGVIALCVLAWTLIAWLTRGPWAMRRV